MNDLYLVFDKNMALMTGSITLAFLMRSSSLVGWVPIAMSAIFQSTSPIITFYNLLAII